MIFFLATVKMINVAQAAYEILPSFSSSPRELENDPLWVQLRIL